MTDPFADTEINWGNLESRRKARKHQLYAKLTDVLAENAQLRESVARLMKMKRQLPAFQEPVCGNDSDSVPAGWPEHYGVRIPRADGFHESDRAWVMVRHGVVTQAGLKDRSILSRLITDEVLDPGASDDAKILAGWKRAFVAKLENIRQEHRKDGIPSTWTQEDRYQKLNQPENTTRLRWIELACDPAPCAQIMNFAVKNPQHYRNAFNWLHAAIKRINQQARDADKAAQTYDPLMQ